MNTDTKKQGGGLQGLIAGDSSISTVGIGLGLNYRGYDIKVFKYIKPVNLFYKDLSKYSSFEEIAYLLLIGSLPTVEQLN